jgi:UDP-glucose-4-epimerase GalE
LSAPFVLVTGGAGYVGSHFVAALEDAALPYVVLDNLSRGRAAFVPAHNLVEGDISDEALVERICRERNVDTVVHFAAYAYVGESVAEPALYYRNNVAKTVALVDAARRGGAGSFVFSSSCATYGEVSGGAPIAETTAQDPVNPYGRTKLMVEQMLADYEGAYGLRSVCLRYFNAAGAAESRDLFEQHDPETHLIPLAIDAALGSRTLEIFGNDYPTPDGTCVRDYIHVDDLATAHVRAVERLRHKGDSLRANLGIGQGASVLEIVKAVESLTGAAVRYRFAARRPGDPATLVADAALARRELGWEPRYRDVSEIVRTAIGGYQRSHRGATV